MLARVAAIAIIAIVPLLASSAAFAACDTWSLGTSGGWSTSTNWSGGTPSTSTDACIIDGTSNVSLSATSGAANLTINLGNTITFNGQTLQVAGTSLANAGTLAVGSGTLEILNTADTLTTGGIVQLTSGGVIEQSSGGQTLANTDNTIQGAGVIGSNGLALDNQLGGTVNANVSGTLTLNGGGTVTNAGLLEATGSGTLQISNTVNNTGNITANAGTVDVTATINGGTLNSINSGHLQANGANTLNGVTLSSGSTFAVGGSTTQLEGTITNNGTFTTNNGIIQVVGSAVTLQGGGTVQMSNGAWFNLNSGGQTLHNVDNTIEGSGQLGQNGLALDNQSSGTVNANISGATMFMNGGGAVSNAGLLEATNGGTLAISNTVTNTGAGNITANGGTVNLGSTINGGTLNTINSGVMQASGGNPTLNGVTLSTGSTFNDAGTTLLQGTITNNGTITVPNGTLQIVGDVTLQGGGAVQMSSNAFFNQNSGGQTLHNVDNTIEATGQLGQNGMSLDNQASGTVNANVSGGTLSMNGGGAVSNAGLLEATNGGTLQINNAVTNTGAGNITANGGTVNLASTVNGGTLNTENSGVMQASGGSPMLNGVTLSTNSTFDVGGGTTQLEGTITNNGTFTVPNGTLQIIGAAVTLTGGGTVQMQSDAFFNQNSGGQTLHNVDNTIEGSGQLGQNGMLLDNQSGGTVNANVSGGTLFVNGGGAVTNAGLLEATNGGILQINNTVNNTANITANTGSTVGIAATINGGTLNTVGTGVMQTNGGALLNGVTLSSGSTYNVSGGTTQLEGTITNNGTFTIPNGTLQIVGAAVTLTGGGTVQMQNDAFFNQNSGGQTLHNVNNTIEGSGQLGQNGLALDNQSGGTVNANVDGGTLFLNGGGTVTNAGTLEASNGGTMTVSNPLAATTYSAGTITGHYIVDGTGAGPSNLQINALGTSGGEITTIGDGTIASSITLNGTNANTKFTDGGGKNALALGTVNTNASLTLQGGYAITTPGALSNAGTVTLGNATLTDTGFTNTGLLTGNGTVTNTGGGAVSNSGQVTASGGNLVLSKGVTGTTGNVTVNSGASLDISGASGGNTVGTLLLQHTGGLTIGSQNVTVSSDYNNADFGSGNSFNNHANVTGGGLILAAGTGLSMTVSGTGVTGGGTPTPTLALGNVHVGTALGGTFDINWAGTNAPVLRGGVGSTSGLSVSAPLFGPVSPGNSTPETVSATPTAAGALSGQTLSVKPNFDNVAAQTIGVTGAAYDLANPTISTTQPIAFGNVHVNATPSRSLSIANTTISSAAFQEGLDAAVTGTTGGVTTTGGPISNLAAGAPASTAIAVGINTTTAGDKSGTATIGFTSDGSTTSHLASTPLTAQNVQVTGAVYNLAQSSSIGPINLGVLHTNTGTQTQNLSISNVAPAGSFTEGLDSSFGSYSNNGGSITPTFNGSISNLSVATGVSNAMSVSVNTNTSGAGTINGTITIHQDSNGTIDGLANTPLADQTPSVSGSVIATLTNLAVAVINNAQPISFGNVRINTATTAQAVSVTNGAPVSAFSEGLIGNATGTTGTGIIALGGFGSAGNSPAAGQTNPPNPPGSGSISVNIDTSSGGAKSGNAVIDFQSDGTGFSGGTVTDLGATNVAVTGNVYRLANPTLNTPAVTLAARVNGPLTTANVSVSNTSPDIYTEALKASFGTAPTGFSNTGSLGSSGLAAQGTNASSLTVGLASTTTSGITTGTATLNYLSTGAGTDGAADIAPTHASDTVSLTGKVYQTAVASVTPGVSFGIVHVGDTVGAQTITVTNTATGALVDSITGGMNVSGAPFSVVGGGTLGGGVAGNNGSSGSALRVGLNTSTAGVYTGANAGSATLTLASHDSDLADLALTTSPVTLSATVNNYAAVGLASTTRGSLTGGGSAYTLNLGTLTQGSGLISAALAALNAALGPADALSLGIDSTAYTVESGSGFGLALNAFADLAAGDTQSNAFDVSLDTSGTGTFDEVIKFDGYGSNADYSDNNANVLDPTLTIEATVSPSGPPTGVPEPSSWLMLLSALAGLGGIRRLRRGGQARVD